MQNENNFTSTDTTPPKLTDKRKKFALIAGVLLLIIIAIALLLPHKNSKSNTEQKATSKSGQLTVGSKPYVYPCNVATEQDYRNIFGLNNPDVGTIAQTSALNPKYISGGTDLAKVAPGDSSIPQYEASCTYTMAKKDSGRPNTIGVTITQFSSDQDAKGDFEVHMPSAAELQSSNSSKPSPLPSFSKNSFIKPSDPADSSKEISATVLSGHTTIKLTYSFVAPDTDSTITPLLDSYQKKIVANLNGKVKTEPLDLTGHDTFVHKKLVDLCQRTDIKKLTGLFEGINLRLDQMSSTQKYGSLAGSRSAQDGATSACHYRFNTKTDRDAQKAYEKDAGIEGTLLVGARYPHELSIQSNTFASVGDAKASLATMKATVSQADGDTAPSVQDVSGIADGGFRAHKEFTEESTDALDGHDISFTVATDQYTILSGEDIITVSLVQKSGGSPYKSTPLTITDSQFQSGFKLLQEVIKNNR